MGVYKEGKNWKVQVYYKDMDVRLRENTMCTKRYIIDLKIKPYFEKKILSEITVADVRAWQNELLTYKDSSASFCRFVSSASVLTR